VTGKAVTEAGQEEAEGPGVSGKAGDRRIGWIWTAVASAAGLLGLSAAAYGQVPGMMPPGVDSLAAGASASVGEFLSGLFHLSTTNAREKLARVVVVVAIVVIAKYAMILVKVVTQKVMLSERGLRRFGFADRQRMVTLYGLGLSIAKYVIYLSAFGYILNELGMDYRAYMASVSLVGIAVGFGSQGLVQDIVTGFFILFENQFSVGDMVEISGQVGIVEEIGLRTTRIRNYHGAVVTLQNRNIPMALRYRQGGQEVVVDVAIAAAADRERASALLGEIGREVAEQFDDVILEAPVVKGLVTLKTKEMFVRLYAKVWPGQTWVVDAQLVPRIREVFAREGIAIQGDRVVVFYHVAKECET
jgi:small conductance mechanosensitive channel